VAARQAQKGEAPSSKKASKHNFQLWFAFLEVVWSLGFDFWSFSVTIPAPSKEGVYSEGFKMGYKLKPHKGVASRFRVTATGKLKHSHELNSHLRSNRNAKKKRALGRPSVLDEGHARRFRSLMAISGMKPAKVAHERALAAAKKGDEKK
jgi:large subunit ribosomal protein L35